MSHDTLLKIRKQLDTVDSKIVQLLEERFDLTDQVAIYKDKHGIPLTDRQRELDLLNAIRSKIAHPVLKEHISEIYEKIFLLNKTARVFKHHKTLPFKKIGIIGLGLIGGSIVKALKMKSQDAEMYTLQRESEDVKLAVKQEYITTVKDLNELVSKVELVIIASPIDTVIPVAKELSQIKSKTNLIVIDVASVKKNIVKEFEKLSTSKIDFCGTHPMAGSEKMGFENTQGMLFVSKPWVITPHKKNNKQTIKNIKNLITYLGSTTVTVTASQHDEYVAAISHIVFLISSYIFSFIQLKEPKALALAGSGFESLTRLASGSPRMHTEIVTQNYDNIAVSLVSFMEFIKQHQLVKDSLLQFFSDTKTARDIFINHRSSNL